MKAKVFHYHEEIMEVKEAIEAEGINTDDFSSKNIDNMLLSVDIIVNGYSQSYYAFVHNTSQGTISRANSDGKFVALMLLGKYKLNHLATLAENPIEALGQGSMPNYKCFLKRVLDITDCEAKELLKELCNYEATRFGIRENGVFTTDITLICPTEGE